jgi:hypothetical protein
LRGPRLQWEARSSSDGRDDGGTSRRCVELADEISRVHLRGADEGVDRGPGGPPHRLKLREPREKAGQGAAE